MTLHLIKTDNGCRRVAHCGVNYSRSNFYRMTFISSDTTCVSCKREFYQSALYEKFGGIALGHKDEPYSTNEDEYGWLTKNDFLLPVRWE